MVGSASFDDRWRAIGPQWQNSTQLSQVHQTCPYHCTAIHQKQCFQMDISPVAQRVSNNYADQGQLFYFHVSTLAICESMSRPRVVMTPEELSCILKPFVTARSWLVYDESAQVSEAKLHKGNVVKHVALLTALHEHSPSLVFTWSVVSAVLKQLLVQFGLSQDSSKDWLDTKTNRLQILCRTVSQSLRKNPRSEFAATVPWSPTATDTAVELGYIVGTIENSVWLGVVWRF